MKVLEMLMKARTISRSHVEAHNLLPSCGTLR